MQRLQRPSDDSSQPSFARAQGKPAAAPMANAKEVATMNRVLRACALMLAVSSCSISNNAYSPAVTTGAARAAQSARFESEHRWGNGSDNRWEPVVAADPSSPWIYQMTTGQRPDYLLFRASSDRGATWSPARHICRRGTR